MLLLVLFVYFLYMDFICCWLIYNYSILIFFNSFYLFFNYLFLWRKFNINYLRNPNIVAVALSQSFNAVIHFINYLCLNWLILVFSGIVLLLSLFIYELRARVRLRVTIRKSFLKNNSKIIFLFICLIYLCFSKLDKVL